MSAIRQLRLPFMTARNLTIMPDDRATMRLLERLAGVHAEVWHSTKTIAAKLGIEVRSAQLRLRRLIDLGLLKRVRDYSVKTRRRLAILWRDDSGLTSIRERNDCAESAQCAALRNDLPPHPPIEEPEGKDVEERTDDGKATPSLQLSLETPETGPEKHDQTEDPDTTKVVEAAKAVLPWWPVFPGRVAKLAQRYGVEATLYALERLRIKGKTEWVSNPVAYVSRTLALLRAEGVGLEPTPDDFALRMLKVEWREANRASL